MTAEPRHYDLLRKPVVTEKSTALAVNNALVFEVAMDTDKPAIREAVEKVFEVKVEGVNTLVRKGKRKRFRGRPGRCRNRKMAIVTLRKGHSIDFSAGA